MVSKRSVNLGGGANELLGPAVGEIHRLVPDSVGVGWTSGLASAWLMGHASRRPAIDLPVAERSDTTGKAVPRGRIPAGMPAGSRCIKSFAMSGQEGLASLRDA